MNLEFCRLYYQRYVLPTLWTPPQKTPFAVRGNHTQQEEKNDILRNNCFQPLYFGMLQYLLQVNKNIFFYSVHVIMIFCVGSTWQSVPSAHLRFLIKLNASQYNNDRAGKASFMLFFGVCLIVFLKAGFELETSRCILSKLCKQEAM